MLAPFCRWVIPPLVVVLGLVAFRLFATATAELPERRVLRTAAEPNLIAPRYDEPRVITDEQLRAVLDRVKPPMRPLKTNNLVHALRLWGPSADFGDPQIPTGREMRDYFLDDRTFRRLAGESAPPLFYRDRDGLAVRSYRRRRGEPRHVELSLRRFVGDAGRMPHAAGDADALARRRGDGRRAAARFAGRFHLDRFEYEWALIAYARYVFPQSEFRNQWGERIRVDDLVAEAIGPPLDLGPCNGLHRLEGLVVLLRADEQHRALRPQTRAAILEHLQRVEPATCCRRKLPMATGPATGRKVQPLPEPAACQSGLAARQAARHRASPGMARAGTRGGAAAAGDDRPRRPVAHPHAARNGPENAGRSLWSLHARRPGPGPVAEQGPVRSVEERRQPIASVRPPQPSSASPSPRTPCPPRPSRLPARATTSPRRTFRTFRGRAVGGDRAVGDLCPDELQSAEPHRPVGAPQLRPLDVEHRDAPHGRSVRRGADAAAAAARNPPDAARRLAVAGDRLRGPATVWQRRARLRPCAAGHARRRLCSWRRRRPRCPAGWAWVAGAAMFVLDLPIVGTIRPQLFGQLGLAPVSARGGRVAQQPPAAGVAADRRRPVGQSARLDPDGAGDSGHGRRRHDLDAASGDHGGNLAAHRSRRGKSPAVARAAPGAGRSVLQSARPLALACGRSSSASMRPCRASSNGGPGHVAA